MPDYPIPRKPEYARVEVNMFVMFADMQGMKGATVPADLFCRVLCQYLAHALSKKRPSIPPEHFLRHMDYASSQTAGAIDLELALFGLEMVSYRPYSPNLDPSDCHFPSYKFTTKGLEISSFSPFMIWQLKPHSTSSSGTGVCTTSGYAIFKE